MLTLHKRQIINHIQVSVVFFCFVVLLVRVGPNWSNVFLGYIPSKALFQTRPDALYTGKRRFLTSGHRGIEHLLMQLLGYWEQQ